MRTCHPLRSCFFLFLYTRQYSYSSPFSFIFLPYFFCSVFFRRLYSLQRSIVYNRPPLPDRFSCNVASLKESGGKISLKPIFVSVSRIDTQTKRIPLDSCFFFFFLSFYFFFFFLSRTYRDRQPRIGSALIRDVSFESGQGYKFCLGGGRAGKKESSRKENINTILGQGVVFYLRVLVVGITLQRFLSPPSVSISNIFFFFFFFFSRLSIFHQAIRAPTEWTRIERRPIHRS